MIKRFEEIFFFFDDKKLHTILSIVCTFLIRSATGKWVLFLYTRRNFQACTKLMERRMET